MFGEQHDFRSMAEIVGEPELPAVRVTESTDVLGVIFEHCGLPSLRTLQRVCKP